MSLIRHSHVSLSMFSVLMLLAPVQTLPGQTSGDSKFALRAALVLTPEFCSTEIKQGDKVWTGVEKFEVGPAACAELEPALQAVFHQLNRVAASPASDTADVVILPRVVSASATRRKGITIFNRPEKDLLVALELTIKDPAGNTVWLQTVEGTGTAKGRPNGTLSKKDMKILVDAAVADAVKQVAEKVSSAPELRKFAEHVTPPKR